MLTRLQDYEKMRTPNSAPIVFSERSIFSDRHVFFRNFEKGNVVNKAEQAVYSEWCDFVVDKIDYKIDGLIYLRASTDTCLKRCQKRSRDEEKCIGVDLLQQIEDRHEEWLKDSQFYNDIPVLVIDTNDGLFFI